MQLPNIDTVKLDYAPSKVKFVANPREKAVNQLSMYGSAMVPAKSTAKPSINRIKLTKRDREIKTQTVSRVFSVCFFFESKSHFRISFF